MYTFVPFNCTSSLQVSSGERGAGEREREGERMRVEEDLAIITGGVLMFERLYGK